jgi:hypothetical protein
MYRQTSRHVSPFHTSFPCDNGRLFTLSKSPVVCAFKRGFGQGLKTCKEPCVLHQPVKKRGSQTRLCYAHDSSHVREIVLHVAAAYMYVSTLLLGQIIELIQNVSSSQTYNSQCVFQQFTQTHVFALQSQSMYHGTAEPLGRDGEADEPVQTRHHTQCGPATATFSNLHS